MFFLVRPHTLKPFCTLCRPAFLVLSVSTVCTTHKSRLPPYRFYVILPFSFIIRLPTTRTTMHYFAYGRNCHSGNFRFMFYRFPPNKMHLESGNYHANTLLFSNCIAVILTLNPLTDKVIVISCACSHEVSHKTDRNHLHAIFPIYYRPLR